MVLSRNHTLALGHVVASLAAFSIFNVTEVFEAAAVEPNIVC